jgi:hypothetical protein
MCVRADSVKRGDPGELRSVEPVLLGNGVVMPANARISGRIAGAAPLHDDKPSWLVLLVEKAEWKQGSARLHAFISRQIKIEANSPNSTQATDRAAPVTSVRRAGRISGRALVENGEISAGPLPDDAVTPAGPSGLGKPVLPKEVRTVTDSDGVVYLFSASSNVVLPSGVLLVLQNQGSAPPAKSAGADSSHRLLADRR